MNHRKISFSLYLGLTLSSATIASDLNVNQDEQKARSTTVPSSVVNLTEASPQQLEVQKAAERKAQAEKNIIEIPNASLLRLEEIKKNYPCKLLSSGENINYSVATTRRKISEYQTFVLQGKSVGHLSYNLKQLYTDLNFSYSSQDEEITLSNNASEHSGYKNIVRAILKRERALFAQSLDDELVKQGITRENFETLLRQQELNGQQARQVEVQMQQRRAQNDLTAAWPRQNGLDVVAFSSNTNNNDAKVKKEKGLCKEFCVNGI